MTAAVIGLSGCGLLAPQPKPTSTLSAFPFDEIEKETAKFGRTLIGETEKEALRQIKETGYVGRVVARDSEVFVITMDYNPRRVDLHILKGIVVKTSVG